MNADDLILISGYLRVASSLTLESARECETDPSHHLIVHERTNA